MSDIKILGKIIAGRADGVLMDDDGIYGGYKVVKNLEELNLLAITSLKKGTPAYVEEQKKTYRWDGSHWNLEEDEGLTAIDESEIEGLFK